MQNIKKFLIFSTLVFSTFKCFCVGDLINIEIGKKAAKELAPYLVGMAEGIGSEAAKALAISNVEIAQVLAPAFVDVAEILAPAAVDIATGIGVDAVTAFGNSNVEIAKVITEGNLAIVKEVMPYAGPVMIGVTVVAVVGVAAYSVTQLQPIAKDTYEFIYPTEEQQEKSAVAGRKVKYYKAEDKFIDCMISSKPNSKINESGLPIDCEELARIFAACGGKNQVDKTTHDLMSFRK